MSLFVDLFPFVFAISILCMLCILWIILATHWEMLDDLNDKVSVCNDKIRQYEDKLARAHII